MKKLSATVLPLMLFMACLLSDQAKAQPRSAGGQFSLNGIDVSFQHSVRDTVFIELNAGIDLLEVLDGRTAKPGAKARLTYNFIFWNRKYESGTMSLYAGPGISAGYVRNEGTFGPAIGICGQFGLEYSFITRPLILSISIVPSVALHMKPEGIDYSLDFFKKGFLYSLSPSLGLRYCF